MNQLIDGFIKRRQVHALVCYAAIGGAIAREKAIREGKRTGKVEQIEQCNRQWRALHEEFG